MPPRFDRSKTEAKIACPVAAGLALRRPEPNSTLLGRGLVRRRSCHRHGLVVWLPRGAAVPPCPACAREAEEQAAREARAARQAELAAKRAERAAEKARARQAATVSGVA